MESGWHVRLEQWEESYRPVVGAGAWTLYTALKRFANRDGCCWPSQRRLKADTGLSWYGLHRGLAQLEKHGLTRIDGSDRRRHLYVMACTPQQAADNAEAYKQLHSVDNLLHEPVQDLLDSGPSALKSEQICSDFRADNINKRQNQRQLYMKFAEVAVEANAYRVARKLLWHIRCWDHVAEALLYDHEPEDIIQAVKNALAKQIDMERQGIQWRKAPQYVKGQLEKKSGRLAENRLTKKLWPQMREKWKKLMENVE